MTAKEIQHILDSKTKPQGSLGMLEQIAFKICMVQQTLQPKLNKPNLLVFTADHGITAEGVSAYPASVTTQMVHNFLVGGAAINVFCRQHGITLKVVDAGVNADFKPHPLLINAKVAKGTKNLIQENAMSATQLQYCFTQADLIIDEIANGGSNIIGFGEMGIGNTSSASLLMSAICKLPIVDCVGAGTGLNEEKILHKVEVLKQAQQNKAEPTDVLTALQYFGGFEIAQMCGAMLSAYRNHMLILVDGFIANVAYLCAQKINSEISSHAIFCHQSEERGHGLLLNYLNAKPILHLGMRLGEGTGCALAYPLIQSAVLFVNEMASFESAGVDHKSN